MRADSSEERFMTIGDPVERDDEYCRGDVWYIQPYRSDTV